MVFGIGVELIVGLYRNIFEIMELIFLCLKLVENEDSFGNKEEFCIWG